jgi:hypothetical protein
VDPISVLVALLGLGVVVGLVATLRRLRRPVD